MLREFHADLHIHTCLSPCASLGLSPRTIIERAKEEKLDIIAITDHNTVQNVQVVMSLGGKEGIRVLPGIEVQSREEIHILTLFDDWASIQTWAQEISQNLPDIPNEPDILGDQPVVDEEGNILSFEKRMLLNSLHLSLEEIINRVKEQGGLSIPSHFDGNGFSVISQLGFIPEGIHLEALERSRENRPRIKGNFFTRDFGIPWIFSSDAHHPEEIGAARTVFLLAEASLQEIRLALRNQDGRRVLKKMDRGAVFS
jgi:3',5'-nucleoside bisphosphate phosphatase